MIHLTAALPAETSQWFNDIWLALTSAFTTERFVEGVDGERSDTEAAENGAPSRLDTYSDDLYNTVLIPYGVTESDRKDYILTSYVNDINRVNEEVLMEYGANGKVSAVYDYGVQRNNFEYDGNTEYYTYDGRGSVANLTDNSGSSKVSYSYDTYGVATANTYSKNKYDYNAEATDYNTGYQYLRARYYNPNNGNFITQDTYTGELSDPLTQNLYTYAGNDPLNIQDPSGHGWLKNAWNGVKSAASSAVSGVKKLLQTL